VAHAFEWYPTPDPLTRFLLRHLPTKPSRVEQWLEPCVGDGAIVRVLRDHGYGGAVTNDLDTRWGADYHEDACAPTLYAQTAADLIVTNPPFTLAFPMLERFLAAAPVVAVFHRVTLMEPLKTPGPGQEFFRAHPPTMVLHCPRFAHRRSQKTGDWSTDSAHSVWSIWDQRGPGATTMVWPDAPVFEDLAAFTPGYRDYMDRMTEGR
jgi:hypothetical protein